MYIAPGQGQTNPWGQNFDVNRNSLSLCPFVASLKKLFEVWFFTVFYVFFFPHVYCPSQGQITHWVQKFYDNTKAYSLCPYVASFKMISSKSDFIHTFNHFIHVYSPGARAKKILGDKLVMSTESPYHFDNLLQFSNKSLWILILYAFFNDFHKYIAPGQGQATLCGQNPDVNRKALSLCPFVASFKNISLKSDCIHIFSCFIHVYSPGAGADKPLGVRIFI